MKVALLTDGIFPYVMGGMQKHSYYLARYFARNFVMVELYHTNQSEYDINKLEFFTEEEKKYINSIVIDFPSHLGFPGHYIRESYEYSNLILKEYKKQEPVDFIYAKGFTALAFFEEKLKGGLFPPIGLNFHGYEMFQKAPSFKVKLEHLLLRNPVLFSIRHADYLFSYGGKISEILIRLGIEKSRIIEIPAAIEETWLAHDGKLHKAEAGRKFVFIGRYERRKGIEELTGAIKKLLPLKDFEFNFIGPIPSEKRISDPKIFYHGSVTDTNRIKDILQRCDVLVCPSYSEGMPNVILEGMACGLAILASDVGAVNQMVGDDNGWLISFADTNHLFQKVLEVIDLPDNRLVSLKKASLHKVSQNFLWDSVILQTIEKIKKAIA